MNRAVLGLSLWLLAVPLSAAESPGPGECATCHPAAKVQWRESVHAREGMVCADCHGGDPAAEEADPGHLGMRWFDRSSQVVEICGGCHADALRMRPYNLPVDQRTLYRESAHGRARSAGDELAPLCTDCHDNHHVLTASDPESPTFPTNLPRTCGTCHSDVELAEREGLDDGVVDGFRRSPHGRALDGRDFGNGPTCASCHDGHGAALPLHADVDEICGGCHRETRASLRAGVHQAILERRNLAGCASCHSVHGGLEAGALDAICVDCHTEDSAQVALGNDLERLLRQAEEEVARAEAALFRANRVPVKVRDHQALVEDARSYLRQAGSRLHTFRREPIEELARASRSIAVRVQEEIDYRLERKSARTTLSILWFYAAVTLGVLYSFRRRALSGGGS